MPLLLATIVVLLGLLLIVALVIGRFRHRRLSSLPRDPETEPLDAWEEAGRRFKE